MALIFNGLGKKKQKILRGSDLRKKINKIITERCA